MDIWKIQGTYNIQVENDSKYNTMLTSIPYIPPPSGKIRNIERILNSKIVLKKHSKSILKKITLQTIHKNYVCKIPCECCKFYFGERSRPLNIRMKEHQNNEKNKNCHKY